jgi:hypothetical protein
MKNKMFVAAFLALSVGTSLLRAADSKAAGDAGWAMNATTIESCSCPMFCPCYFQTSPAGHNHGGKTEHYCMFNMGYRVNHGYYGKTKLDGALFWLAGDLGADWSKGNTDWVVVTFDPAVTPEQREGITKIVGHVFPVKWNSMKVASDAKIEWKATVERAEARLDGGKAGEVILKRNPGMTSGPTVITNLRYFGAPRNDGFVLMPNEVNAYRIGEKPFETHGTNGFMTTIDISSKDLPKAAGM